MLIVKEFTFDSAHNLEWHDGKCKNLHGHTYKMQIGVMGDLNENGIVVDFGDLKKIVREWVIDLLDHQNLNDKLKNPTAERLVQHIWAVLSYKFQDKDYKLALVRLWETPTSYAEMNLSDSALDKVEFDNAPPVFRRKQIDED